MGQIRTAGINQARLSARWSSASPYIRSSGFILFYSLWILTVIGLTMAVAIKQQRSAAKVNSAQLDYVLQQRQLLNVLDYVLTNSYEQTINNDSRAAAYEKVAAVQSKGNVNALKEDFCAMFGSKNFGLVSEDDPLCSKKKASNNAQETEGVENTGSVKKLGMYKPMKTSYTLKVKMLTYNISIWPSNAYPNLNTLNKKALNGYLRYLGLSKENARQLAGTIKDWVDEDDFTDPSGGAEWGAYSQIKQPYKPRNAPIKNWQELNYLLRADPALITLLRQNFVLQGSEKVLAEYVNNDQIVALSGVKKSVVDNWRLQKKQKSFSSKEIDSKDLQKIDGVIGNKPEADHWVIKISSGKNQLTAWFNIKSKLLQDWSISPDLPPSLPLNLNVSDID